MMSPKPSTSSVSPTTTSSSVPVRQRVASAPPTRLDIPSIGVHAAVGQLAVTKDPDTGQYGLYPPEATWDDLLRAYWWNESAVPGYPTMKTTFIVGHTCHAQGCPAVFNRLQAARRGTLVQVATSKGRLTYRVFKTHDYAKSAITNVGEVYANVPNRLVLVTCKLRKDGQLQTDNFVAWATLVASQRR